MNTHGINAQQFKYKHVIWDWNGTLLDDAWLCVDVMNRMLKERNMQPLSLEHYQAIFDFPVIDYYRRVGFDFEKESFVSLGTRFITEYEERRHECQLHEDAHKTLQWFHANNIEQSILSAYRHEPLIELLSYFNIDHFFAHAVGLTDHYAHGKRHIGLEFIKNSKHHPHETLFIGDTTHDYDVAKAMKIDCCLIPRGNHSEEKLKQCGVPVLANLDELLNSFLLS